MVDVPSSIITPRHAGFKIDFKMSQELVPRASKKNLRTVAFLTCQRRANARPPRRSDAKRRRFAAQSCVVFSLSFTYCISRISQFFISVLIPPRFLRRRWRPYFTSVGSGTITTGYATGLPSKARCSVVKVRKRLATETHKAALMYLGTKQRIF